MTHFCKFKFFPVSDWCKRWKTEVFNLSRRDWVGKMLFCEFLFHSRTKIHLRQQYEWNEMSHLCLLLYFEINELIVIEFIYFCNNNWKIHRIWLSKEVLQIFLDKNQVLIILSWYQTRLFGVAQFIYFGKSYKITKTKITMIIPFKFRRNKN